jgi:alkylation response protein AidB-like acyl-CoA dehydrogenase
VGTAFLAGYRAAVEHLTGVTSGSLAATEDGPVHPRTVATRLQDGRVTGRKRFVTGVPGAERLVVLALAGEDGDRRDLRAVVVPTDRVEVRPLGPFPFVPEVPHAEVVLDGVPVESVIPGDGWADVVKPFRTVEDLHVLAAVLAYAASRAELGRDDLCAVLASLAALAALWRADPRDPTTHLALAGVFAHGAVDRVRWPPGEEGERWTRDRPLLQVAQKARDARLAAAWDTRAACRTDSASTGSS